VRGDFQKNRNEFIALLLGISFSSPEFMELHGASGAGGAEGLRTFSAFLLEVSLQALLDLLEGEGFSFRHGRDAEIELNVVGHKEDRTGNFALPPFYNTGGQAAQGAKVTMTQNAIAPGVFSVSLKMHQERSFGIRQPS
jgi:hypothetical protein